MPIPRPAKGETESNFISRCMGDSVMTAEYPEQKIRSGVCYTSWKEAAQFAAEFSCECVKCGEVVKSAEHCNTFKCPKCGGEMRRLERPGPGQFAAGKSISNVLCHIALLGGEMPAVSTLDADGILALGKNTDGWIEAFDTGRWKNQDWPLERLQKVVENFRFLKGLKGVNYDPPFIVGHDEKDILASGIPAMGWIDDLKLAGTKLLAYIRDVPEKIRALIKARRYQKVSASIDRNFEFAAAEDNGDGFHKFSTEIDALHTGSERDNDMGDVTISRDEHTRLTAAAGKVGKLEAEIADAKKAGEDAKSADEFSAVEKERDEAKSKLDEFEKKEVERVEKEKVKTADERVKKLVDDKKVLPAFGDTVKTHILGMEDDKFEEYAKKLPTIDDSAVIDPDDEAADEKKADAKLRSQFKKDPYAKEFSLSFEEYKAGVEAETEGGDVLPAVEKDEKKDDKKDE